MVAQTLRSMRRPRVPTRTDAASRASCVASAAMPNVADSLLGLFHPKQERPPPAISAPKPATTASPPRRRNSARKSAPHGSHDGPSSAPWAIKDEDKKRGAGLLFFAYGQLSAIQKYLREATDAAASFRALNPKLQIAIVSNNGTVDARVFSHHITPRPDLLFAGRPFANGADPMPRQWLTRLYYMAHSPYLITWALDSNVISCTPGAALAFLSSASSTGLWGYDMVTALAPKHPLPSPQLRQEPNPYPRLDPDPDPNPNP